MTSTASFWLRRHPDAQYLHFKREWIPALTHASTLLIAFQYIFSNYWTQTLHKYKNDLLAVDELLRQIRTCSLRFNLLEWTSSSESLHDDAQQLWLTSALHRQEICSSQWLILCVMTHVLYNIAFTATDVASEVLNFAKIKLLEIWSNGKTT